MQGSEPLATLKLSLRWSKGAESCASNEAYALTAEL